MAGTVSSCGIRAVSPVWLTTFQRVIQVSFPDCRNSLRTRPTGSSGAQCGPTGLHRHPRVAKYTCVYDVEAASDMAYSAACSSSASQSSPTRIGLLWRLPTSPCLSCFRNDRLDKRTLCTGLLKLKLLLGGGCTTMKSPTLFYVIYAQKLCVKR